MNNLPSTKAIAILTLLVLVAVPVSALTASIGNSRMVLHANVGESVERYVLVKNTNPETVDINISVSGNLSATTVIKDKSFSLAPNEEKEAHFTIKATEPGMTETKIQVAFTAKNSSGVGLSSTVIMIAGGGSSDGSIDNTQGNQTNSTQSNNNSGGQSNIPTSTILIISSILLIIIFAVLVIYYKKSKARKGARRLHA